MALTLVHIIPGALFLALALLQFAPSIRAKHLKVHRWLGRILVVTGLVIGISALVMSFTMNIGGLNETAATTLFVILFLFCLIKAYRHIRRKEVAQHREWMIRAFAISLGVATTRPIVGMFLLFARSRRMNSSVLRFGWDLRSHFSRGKPGSITLGIASSKSA
jgi:uncharacterized membrane protein